MSTTSFRSNVFISFISAEWVDKTNNKSERFNRKFKTYLNECRVKKDINIIQDTVFAYIIHNNLKILE